MFVKEGESHCVAIANVFRMFVKEGESHCVATVFFMPYETGLVGEAVQRV